MKSILCLVVCCFAAGSVLADTAALQRCRQEGAAAARLACYDSIVIPASERAGSGRVGAVPSSVAASGPISEPAGGAASFGLEGRQTVARLEAIESAIDGRFDGWVARSQLRLVNGQVWEISDGSQAAYDLRNPKVRVTRGMSGSFFVAIEGVAQTPRVRRLR